jgi:hypothetical protein
MSGEGPGTFEERIPRRIQARRGFSLVYKGKTLLSRVDPVAQAERIAEAQKPRERTLYFCPSPLYGYGLETFLRNLEQAPHAAVLCVETDEQLLALSRDAIPPSLLNHPRLRLTGIADPAGLCAFVRTSWGSRVFRRLEALRLSPGWRLDPERYDSLAGALEGDMALDWGNAMTLVKLGRRYIKNALRNLALIPRSPSLEALSFGDDPVLVLGAGPSLDGVLDGLAACFGPALAPRPFRIVAVDTALPCLLARNIRPDLVVALESQHWNLRDFIGAAVPIPLAMDLSALPAAGEILGPPRLFYTPWADLRLFQRLAAAGLLPVQFPPLGSVALSAAAIALSLGSGPVLTGGVDFSFTLDAYHARSTPGHQEKLRRQNRFRDILNAAAAFRPAAFRAGAKSGAPVRSDPALRGYRDLFEREFAGEPRLRDITGGGLPLGPPAVDMAGACEILRAGRGGNPAGAAGGGAETAALRDFARRERDALIALRRILTGEAPAPREELEALLDEADYLWAHFPDCAGTGGRRPPAGDVSFLKRIRAELDPFISLWGLTLGELETR